MGKRAIYSCITLQKELENTIRDSRIFISLIQGRMIYRRLKLILCLW